MVRETVPTRSPTPFPSTSQGRLGACAARARVRAAASDDEANSALARLLARTLDVAPREIALLGGATSRVKRLLIRGDARAAAAALERIREAAAK